MTAPRRLQDWPAGAAPAPVAGALQAPPVTAEPGQAQHAAGPSHAAGSADLESLGPPNTLGVARPDVLDDWAELFRALSDGNRLRILLAVHHAPGICVTDLAEAVGMTANATSHALGALRVRGIVRSERSGRERRWKIASEQIHNLLHQVGATHSPLHPEH